MKKETNINYEDIRADLLGECSPEITLAINSLSESDQRILILYSELNSTRRVGDIIGTSHKYIATQLKAIREKIKRYMKANLLI